MTGFEITVCLVLSALAIGKGVTIALLRTLHKEMGEACAKVEELLLRDEERRAQVERDAVTPAPIDPITKTMWGRKRGSS